MRYAVLVAAGLLAGCGKKTEPTETPSRDGVSTEKVAGKGDGAKPPPKEPEKHARPARPPVTAVDPNVLQDYADNFVAADAKWKGKRVRFTDSRVGALGRTREGALYISCESILGQAHNVYYYLTPGQDEAFSKLKRDDSFAVEATVDGREDDGISRGIVGYNFRLNFVDAAIVPPK